MLDRKALNAQAETLMKDYAFEDGNGQPLSGNADIFRANLERVLSEFRNFLDAIGDKEKNKDAINAEKRRVTRACTLYNDEMRVQRIEQLKEMGARNAVIAYLGSQRITGLKVTEKEDVFTVEQNLHVGLDAVDFYEQMLSGDYDYIRDICCIFADNIARRKVADDKKEDGKEVFITKKPIHESYIPLRKKLGWDFTKASEISNRELQRELNYIFARLCFLPAEDIKEERWQIKCVNADWRYIRDTLIDTNGAKKATDDEGRKGANDSDDRGVTNKNGSYTIRDESTIIRAIFRAMFTRYNNGFYDYTVENNSTKKARVSEPNRDMSENSNGREFVKNDTPEAGPVTLGTPEK